jgi:hypothetical protein
VTDESTASFDRDSAEVRSTARNRHHRHSPGFNLNVLGDIDFTIDGPLIFSDTVSHQT